MRGVWTWAVHVAVPYVGMGVDNGDIDDMGDVGTGSTGMGGLGNVVVNDLVCARVTSGLPWS